jgi:hypothetical protein
MAITISTPSSPILELLALIRGNVKGVFGPQQGREEQSITLQPSTHNPLPSEGGPAFQHLSVSAFQHFPQEPSTNNQQPTTNEPAPLSTRGFGRDFCGVAGERFHAGRHADAWPGQSQTHARPTRRVL